MPKFEPPTELKASLPSRERELKLEIPPRLQAYMLSLPSRERELKHVGAAEVARIVASLPSRERELKQTPANT